MIPKNPVDRYHFVIVMPLNSAGHGPASIEDATSLTYEVWTQDLLSMGSYSYLPAAIFACEELNRAHYGVE